MPVPNTTDWFQTVLHLVTAQVLVRLMCHSVGISRAQQGADCLHKTDQASGISAWYKTPHTVDRAFSTRLYSEMSARLVKTNGLSSQGCLGTKLLEQIRASTNVVYQASIPDSITGGWLQRSWFMSFPQPTPAWTFLTISVKLLIVACQLLTEIKLQKLLCLSVNSVA